MKIRSITLFLNPSLPINLESLQLIQDFFTRSVPAFTQAGYEVQTRRLATTPFPLWLMDGNDDAIPGRAAQLERELCSLGVDYLSLGPALPANPAGYRVIPAILAATKNTFLAGMLTTSDGGISLPAIQACAQVIHATARISPDGFANLRFAALANAPAGTPFFPAAYHHGDQAGFALATESADLVLEAFQSASSLAEARELMIQAIESHAERLAACATQLAAGTGVAFGGIDFTPAPFPETARSLGSALEALGVPELGLHGSLAAAAILTSILDQARFPRAGFNGLMLPALEDATVANRVAEGVLSINDLLMYSAVCGTGLDTLPLPGDTSPAQLAALLLDIAALAQRLDKPLTARLMPIPGKRAGDPIAFDFAYFASSRVLALEAKPLHGLLAGDEVFKLISRGKQV